MSDHFNAAFKFVLAIEKTVYTNHPLDSGGPTRYGVTLRAYASFVGRVVMPDDIKNLTIEEARRFYLERYWKPLGCTRVTERRIALCLFDSGVLYGVGTTGVLAQEALLACGLPVKIDGVIGDESLRALNLVKPDDFILHLHQLLLRRIDFVVSLHVKNETFRKGWINRANRLLTLAGSGPLNGKDT